MGLRRSLFALIIVCCCLSMAAQTMTLKEAFRDCWRTCVSVNQWQVQAEKASDGVTYTGMVGLDQTADWQVVTKHFDWVVAENCMKCEVIHPKEGVYDFTLADQFVDKARAAGLKVLGHCLIWHSQCALWFHVDDQGKLVSPEVLKKRMREHIITVVSHFKGRVDAWDVVNEAFEDDGTLRKSLFWQILGDDFIPLAFQYAREADPVAELYYNDYSMNKPAKVEGVARFFRPLINQGMPITAIGMQGHMILEDGLDVIRQYDHSVKTITALGVPTFFSELDLSVLPNPYGFSGANVSDRFAYSPQMDPYVNSLPADKEEEANIFWEKFFQMMLTHRDSVLRMGFWNVNDRCSWRNDFPIRGRHDYATLFDRNNQPKAVVQRLINLVKPQATLSAPSKKKKK